MNPTQDISTISDTTVLEAMAYRQIAAKEQAENNLKVINERLGVLYATPADAVSEDVTEAPTDTEAAPSE